MKIVNQNVREAAAKAGIRYWRIADVIGISPGYLSAKLRHVLPLSEERKILRIIADLHAEDEREAREAVNAECYC